MQPFPASTVFGRAISKAKFYDKMSVSASVKRAFASQVEEIVWQNKFSAKRLNVQAGERVVEIAVFEIALKKQSASDSLLRAIDNGIPHHILFLLHHNDLWQAAIGYKEIGKTSITLTVKEYYRTPWLPLDHIHLTISGMTMDEVYDNFIRQINTALPAESGQSLKNDLENQERRGKILHQIGVLEKKMRAEKQSHRQFELFQKLQTLKKQLED